jgi:hypothetical protein
MLQLLQDAREKMALPEPRAAGDADDPADADEPRTAFGRAATRCWALLLARIYECLPLLCPRCGEPMRIIAFVRAIGGRTMRLNFLSARIDLNDSTR